MNPLLRAAVFLAIGGCAVPPQAPEPVAETGTIKGEVGDPRNRAKIHTELASLYFQRGNMGVALEELRIAIAADPAYAQAYGMFGLVYMELRELKLAEQNFQRALGLAPQDPDLNHNYGWFLCQIGRESDGIKYFVQATQNPLYTTPSRSFAAAGICALRKDRIGEAEGFFQRALKVEPDDPASLLQLGLIRYRQGNYGDSRTLVSRFNKLIEPTPESLWLALRIERKLGDRMAEASFASQLSRRYPGSREHQLLQRGDFD